MSRADQPTYPEWIGGDILGNKCVEPIDGRPTNPVENGGAIELVTLELSLWRRGANVKKVHDATS